jgi:hypothetical protein
VDNSTDGVSGYQGEEGNHILIGATGNPTTVAPFILPGSATVHTHIRLLFSKFIFKAVKSSYRRVATGPWQIAERDATARLSGHAPTSFLGRKSAQLDTLFHARLCCLSASQFTAPTGPFMLDEYRQRFRAFHTQWQREQYLFLSGRKEADESAWLYREHSDLFSSSSIAELRTKYEETAAYRETERIAIQRLISFAEAGQLASKTHALEAEIAAYETRALIKWHEQNLSIRQAFTLLAQEADAQRRRDLYARYADVNEGADDLRAERLSLRQARAQALGYENLSALQQTWHKVESEKLVGQATQLLAKTESAYSAAIKPLLAREAGVSLDDASAADLSYLQRLPRFAAFFPRARWQEIYVSLFAGLGFSVERQANVEFDSLLRPRKQERAFCAPLEVPEEIKLVVNPDGALGNGYAFYQNFLQAATHTQLYAWTSREGHYEFRVPGDAAVAAAWGSLLGQLLRDAEFLLGAFGFPESSEFRHALAVFRLMQVRRTAALSQYETELYVGRLTNNAGARFAELLTDGVRVRYDETEYLRAVDSPFRAAASLRAWAFEAQLREHLKTRFGARWWDSRKAGEMLIDLWNIGHRHTLEELAALIGLGALDFDWLVSDLLEAVAR